jgi:hypothetical protein
MQKIRAIGLKLIDTYGSGPPAGSRPRSSAYNWSIAINVNTTYIRTYNAARSGSTENGGSVCMSTMASKRSRGVEEPPLQGQGRLRSLNQPMETRDGPGIISICLPRPRSSWATGVRTNTGAGRRS